MRRFSVFTMFLGCVLSGMTAIAQEPAPADKGLPGDGPEVAKKTATQSPGSGEVSEQLKQQITSLETQIKALQATLDKLGDNEKELEQLSGKVAASDAENKALAQRVKTLEADKAALDKRVKFLEGDNASLAEQVQRFSDKVATLESSTPKQQVAAKPAFVKSAVKFHNYEGRALRMNVNGVWHTVKEGDNLVWVPYGPVHIYRYTGAEPRTFSNWQPFMDGYVMEFDVGTAPAEKQKAND